MITNAARTILLSWQNCKGNLGRKILQIAVQNSLDKNEEIDEEKAKEIINACEDIFKKKK